ncbi:hypothetical protein H4R35_005303 [Dimargaris xerosporica]|nr:hypothetical protein H4R35_005303 [Dimargaris xerosporica]
MPNCPIPLRASPIAAQFDRGRVLVYGEFCQPGTETRAATPSSGQSTETLQTAVPNLHLGEGQVWPPLEANCTQSTKADGLASEAVYSNHTFSDRPALQPFISQQIYESQLQNDPFLHGHRVLLLSIDLSTCDWSLVCSSKQLLTTAWSYFELIPRIDDCELIECFGTKPDVSNRHPPCATASTGYSTTTAYHIRMEQLLSDGISGGHWGCMDLVFLGKLTNACFSSAPETCHYSFILPPECLDLWPAAPVPSFAGSSQLLFAAAQGELVDIWFCPDNGQAGKIGAHTVILLSRCPAYRAMMASGMAEAHTNEIVVPESAETVRAWREYLYTDMITCSLTLDSLLELLGLAHMHAFPTLRQLVVLPIIEDYLCFDTATDIIERAVLTRDNALAYVAAKLLVLYRQESLHSTPLGPCNDQVKALIDDYTSQSSCEASNQLSPQTLFASRLLQIFEQ